MRRTWRTCGLILALLCVASRAANSQVLSAFSRAKAEVLLKEQLPCLGCHKLNGDGGTIGPDLTTVRERRSVEYIAAMIADPQRQRPGSAMPLTRMPDGTRDLVSRYLASLPGSATDPTPVTALAQIQASTGEALYARWCAACHGATGKGDGPNATNLPVKPAAHASKEAMSARPDDSLFDTIASGGAIMNRSPRMPAFGATLTPAEIRLLVRHIRTLCKCRGPGWGRAP